MSDEATLHTRAAAMADRFAPVGAAREVRSHVTGHIHDSFVVVTRSGRWLLQRMNARVFPDPRRVMENIVAVTTHLARALVREGAADLERRVLRPAATREGGWLARDEDGERWRAFAFVERAVTHETAATAAWAEKAAEAFGTFQRLLADYDGPPLHETIAGFHDTPARVRALDLAVTANRAGRAGGAAAEIAFASVAERRRSAAALMEAQTRGALPRRIAHHDAKISNVLFDYGDGEALCVVDLDTTMPGLSLYDLGDLVRSMAGPAAEDDPDPARVAAEPERITAIVRGYLRGTGPLLGTAERALIPVAARVIAFEQGVRFLTDHLDGDRYYRCTRPGQNLDRCRTQFALLASLETQEAAIARMVRRP